MHTRSLLALTAAFVFVGCDNSVTQVTPEPVPEANASVAYVVMSPAQPRVGDEVIVSVVARSGASLGRVGSFAAALRYAPQQLRFVAAVSLDGGLRVHNPAEAGLLRMAGASAEGFPAGPLFAARFVVTGASPAANLTLDVSELSSATAYQNLIPSLRVQRGAILSNVTAGPPGTAVQRP